jgi:hypothetical protein
MSDLNQKLDSLESWMSDHGSEFLSRTFVAFTATVSALCLLHPQLFFGALILAAVWMCWALLDCQRPWTAGLGVFLYIAVSAALAALGTMT